MVHKIRSESKNIVIEDFLSSLRLPTEIMKILLTFSPQIFLIPSAERSMNSDVFMNIPEIHIPR